MPIDVLSGAREDLEALAQQDAAAFAVVVAFLQEAEADPRLIDKFTTRGDVGIGQFRTNVKPWSEARQNLHNLFRVRVLDTPATSYRVIYGFDWHTRRIGILAVVHKEDFDYGISSDLANRIIEDWTIATDGRST